MTTQYKWLPSEPTFEMVNAGVTARLYQENPNKPINFVEIFKAMWQAAPEVNQEPLSEDQIRTIYDSIWPAASGLKELLMTDTIKFVRALEKTHGIGV